MFLSQRRKYIVIIPDMTGKLRRRIRMIVLLPLKKRPQFSTLLKAISTTEMFRLKMIFLHSDLAYIFFLENSIVQLGLDLS